MRILIRQALLVTLNAQEEVFTGDLLIEGERIARMGAELGELPAERVIDGRPFIVIPGLVNAHSHLTAYPFKGMLSRLPLEIWRQYGRAARRVGAERDLYVGAMVGLLEMLKSGVTCVLDHHFSGVAAEHMGAEAILRALVDVGMRGALALTISDRPYEETVPLDEATLSAEARRESARVTAHETVGSLTDCEELLRRYTDWHERIRVMPGPSAPQRCSDALLRGCRELAERFGMGVHMHVLETRTQALMTRRLYGVPPVVHLERIGVLWEGLSIAHGVWLVPEEMELLARRGVTVVHNPASNLKLGSGIAPVPQLLRAGVNVALGIDGAPSNDTQNHFDSVRLTGLLHTLTEADYQYWPGAGQVLRMATQGGARAVGLAGETGVLAEGKLADLVLLRRDTPAFTPLNNVLNQLVFCENGSSVDTVIVNGEVVLEGRRSTLVDEEALFAELQNLREGMEPEVAAELEATRALEPPLRRMYLEAMAQPWEGSPRRFQG